MAYLPSREYLLECFDYDKETDTLTWRKRPAEHFDSAGAYRCFMQYVGKEITGKNVTINQKSYKRTKVIFKIIYNTDVKHKTTQKGTYGIYNNRFVCRFTYDWKVLSKSFETEIEAQKWLKEMRVKFFKNELPIVKHRKTTNAGFYGVFKLHNYYYARIYYNGDSIHIRCDTPKEASDAYQLAKQQIKDGVFVPPSKKLSKTGFKGVRASGEKFYSMLKGKYLGTFDTAEEAHAAYLKAKNHKTFDDGLDILTKLAKEYG